MKKMFLRNTDSAVSQREISARALSRTAAEEGIVLLKNDGVLPFSLDTEVAVYGCGALFTSKGGTGSGDVNDRQCVSVVEGLQSLGVVIANEDWLEAYSNIYRCERENWKQQILSKVTGDPRSLLNAYLANPFRIPEGPQPEKTTAKIAIYVLSRQAGEGADRRLCPGDYYLSEGEKRELMQIRTLYEKVVVVLNCGGPIDLQEIDSLVPNALLTISQPGMEGGNALANVLVGIVSPSGRMTDTWAVSYEDYPSAETFLKSEDASEEYREGIYVGYRYFESFHVTPRIPFGYGLSYTSFSVEPMGFVLKENGRDLPDAVITAQVTNTGNCYSGKTVLQVYCHCPIGKLDKEYRRLCGFAKTKELAPGESQTKEITVNIDFLRSFSEEESAYLLEKGTYLFTLGENTDNQVPVAALKLDSDFRILSVEPLKSKTSIFEDLKAPERLQPNTHQVPIIYLTADMYASKKASYDRVPQHEDAKKFANLLSLEQLACLVNGDPVKGQGISDTFGSSGVHVPGAAAETSAVASEEPWKLRNLILADGPAGLRLAQKYYIQKDGTIEKPSFSDGLERGLFSNKHNEKDGEVACYQFCTSFPVGTMLAQSWNVELAEEVGRAVALEMEEFGVDLWLAPGMNIHRNPLCGRNFEYYSEDPLLTGMIAAAVVTGVQKKQGCGATIKHFACNQRENQRKQSNSVVSERALRELYLSGFEWVVKTTDPVAIMSSYNLLNGIHTANSHDLLTKILRMEWGYPGLVMSDWTTTGVGGSSPISCMEAGNDLIMPGTREDIEEIKNAVNSHILPVEKVIDCATRLIATIWRLSAEKA